ncbi:peroxiredoxin [Lactarius indigo]|nr:peroxiredoxin [Lactarius indigo]
MSPAIQSPAPVFSATALVDGAFKEVSLAEYLGQWVIPMSYPLYTRPKILARPLSHSPQPFVHLAVVTLPLSDLPKSSRSTTRSPNLPVSALWCSALRFTDAHGEVCLTNWKEGSKTIRADPLAKLNYFSALANGAHENGRANETKHACMDTK